jgi:hypothetical protein
MQNVLLSPSPPIFSWASRVAVSATCTVATRRVSTDRASAGTLTFVTFYKLFGGCCDFPLASILSRSHPHYQPLPTWLRRRSDPTDPPPRHLPPLHPSTHLIRPSLPASRSAHRQPRLQAQLAALPGLASHHLPASVPPAPSRGMLAPASHWG